MNLAVVTTTWGRPGVTSIALDHLSHLSLGGLDISLFAAVSPEDEFVRQNTEAILSAGGTVIPMPNDNLAAKWNAVMKEAADSGADYILVIGSDNLVNAAFLFESVALLSENDCAEASVVHFYELETGRLIYRHMDQCGIRMFRGDSVRSQDGYLWDASNPKAKAMDSAQDRIIKKVFKIQKIGWPSSAICLDIKHPTVHRVKFRRYMNNLHGETVEAKTFLESHFPGLNHRISRLRAL